MTTTWTRLRPRIRRRILHPSMSTRPSHPRTRWRNSARIQVNRLLASTVPIAVASPAPWRGAASDRRRRARRRRPRRLYQKAYGYSCVRRSRQPLPSTSTSSAHASRRCHHLAKCLPIPRVDSIARSPSRHPRRLRPRLRPRPTTHPPRYRHRPNLNPPPNHHHHCPPHHRSHRRHSHRHRRLLRPVTARPRSRSRTRHPPPPSPPSSPSRRASSPPRTPAREKSSHPRSSCASPRVHAPPRRERLKNPTALGVRRRHREQLFSTAPPRRARRRRRRNHQR
mmetsp:Transcript_1187/g.3720  ORF Transcript_1187/g.3720 Transcript_1187/m.3720 type:complete len:281 (+) Transcript_1187:4368-5210(+)